MLSFLIRRVIYGVLTIWAISVVTFMIFFLIPTGDPAVRIAGKSPTPELIAAINVKYHLKGPLPERYFYTMKELLTGQIKSFTIAHGLFSVIDAFPFQHPESPELGVSIPVGSANPADAGRARLFGQGADGTFDNFVVTTVTKDNDDDNNDD